MPYFSHSAVFYSYRLTLDATFIGKKVMPKGWMIDALLVVGSLISHRIFLCFGWMWRGREARDRGWQCRVNDLGSARSPRIVELARRFHDLASWKRPKPSQCRAGETLSVILVVPYDLHRCPQPVECFLNRPLPTVLSAFLSFFLARSCRSPCRFLTF